MSLISFTPIADGVTSVAAAATNNPLNTIYNDYNGNITDANLSATAGIAFSKVAGGSAGALTSWTAWTPSWTSSGTAPALGNGSFIGSGYTVIGKTCFFRMTLTMGSTTTYGSGSYRFSYPVAPATTSYSTGITYPVNGNTTVYDSSATAAYFMWLANTVVSSTPQLDPVYATSAGSGTLSGEVTATAPVTLAVGDRIIIVGSYEAA